MTTGTDKQKTQRCTCPVCGNRMHVPKKGENHSQVHAARAIAEPGGLVCEKLTPNPLCRLKTGELNSPVATYASTLSP